MSPMLFQSQFEEEKESGELNDSIFRLQMESNELSRIEG